LQPMTGGYGKSSGPASGAAAWKDRRHRPSDGNRLDRGRGRQDLLQQRPAVRGLARPSAETTIQCWAGLPACKNPHLRHLVGE
jgi:hypothetical protein